MTLTADLAATLIERYPERAAALIERYPAAGSLALLARGEPRSAAALLSHLSSDRSVTLVTGLPPDRAAALLCALPLDSAALLMRRLHEDVRNAFLDHLDPQRARDLRAVLRFPPHTAGALMDPGVLALPESFAVREALARVREQPERVRYNLYTIDAEQRLAGVLSLRELLIAQHDARLSELARRDPYRIDANADRAAVAGHPGWHDVYALPVVDGTERYLGAIRYRTLRRIEDDLLRARGEDVSTASALADLFATGAAGLLDALDAGRRSKLQ